MKIENDLARDEVKRLVVRLAVPSMLAQFVSVLYSVVDRMYIGNIPEIGEKALAGVGVSGPIVAMLLAFGHLVGTGGSPLMSIQMGKGNEKEAKKILANSFMMLAVISVAVTILLYLIKDWLLLRFGASEEIFPYAEQYFSVYLSGTVFALMSLGMNQFIISQGFARIGMISVILGAVMNILLDPVFIFLLDMGVGGAALATVISQFFSCVYVLWFLFGQKAAVRISFGGYSLRIIKRIITLGLTPFLIIAFDYILIIALNTALQQWGGAQADKLITCTTIVQSFMMMITMPLGGITGGTQTILGFNFGAKRPDRILEAQKWIIILALAFNSVMFLFAQTVPQYFVYLFTRNPEYVELTVQAIRIYTLGVIPLAVQYEIVDGFTGMGIPSFAMALSMFRKALYLGSVVILPMVLPIDRIFYAEVVSDFGAAMVSSVIYLICIRKLLLRCSEGEAFSGTETVR